MSDDRGVADEWGVPAWLLSRPSRPNLRASIADRALGAADARLYRCRGCGELRYRYRIGRWHRTQPPCSTCGHD